MNFTPRKVLIGVVAIGVCLGAFLFWMNPFATPTGSQVLYTANCENSSSIVLKMNFYPTDNFAQGDTFGYGLFYDTAGKAELSLYNDNYEASGNEVISQGSVPARYVAFEYDSGANVGSDYGVWSYPTASSDTPGPSNIFDPLPSTVTSQNLRVFELPSGTYDRTVSPFNLPPYMNIFLDPKTFSQQDLTTIGDCLEANQASINQALAKLGGLLPSRDQKFYFPLKLGGVVYGLPPYMQTSYENTIAALWDDTQNQIAIPQQGFFTLFPGQSASGTFSRKQIVVSNQNGEPVYQVDNKIITLTYGGPKTGGMVSTNDPDVIIDHQGGYYFGAQPCELDYSANMAPNCPTQIDPSPNEDGSLTFQVSQNQSQ